MSHVIVNGPSGSPWPRGPGSDLESSPMFSSCERIAGQPILCTEPEEVLVRGSAPHIAGQPDQTKSRATLTPRSDSASSSAGAVRGNGADSAKQSQFRGTSTKSMRFKRRSIPAHASRHEFYGVFSSWKRQGCLYFACSLQGEWKLPWHCVISKGSRGSVA